MRMEHWIYTLPLRLRSLFRRGRVEQELDEELQYHLERSVEEAVVRGASPEQARRDALRQMTSLTQRKEECRDTWGSNAVENTIRDFRYGARVLLKSPGFTAVAVLTLALSIGANAVVFGVLNGLVLHPLNTPQAESLYGTEYGTDTGFQSYPNYLDLRDHNRSFEDLAAFRFASVGLNAGDQASAATGYAASGNYFDVLKMQPYLGRFFHAADEQGPNSAPYLVLSYAYWQSRFAEDRSAVGRVVQLNKHPFTIIGVAPPEFRGTLIFVSPDFFMPMVNQEQIDGENLLQARGSTQAVFEAFGHLKPGVTPAQATADLKIVGAYLQRTYPKEFAQQEYALARVGLTSFGPAVRAFMTGLTMLAGLILLAACANLGGLFAARAADRGREIALRLGLGASRQRVMRQLLTEALLISLLGGTAGLLGAVALLRQLSVWQPMPGVNIHIPAAPDAAVYVVAVLLALLSGTLFGIVPLRQVFRTDPYGMIKSGSRTTGERRVKVRELLLGAQIAICAVLVTSSLVAVRGLVRSLHADFGFEPRPVLLLSTNLAMAGYRAKEIPVMQKRMITALESIPGVERAALVNDYPPLVYTAAFRTNVFRQETADLKPANVAIRPYRYAVSPQYFAAAGTPLLAGREFSWHDEKAAQPVAIANREFARRMFGSTTNALGRSFKLQDGTRVQIAGVVENGKYLNLTENQEPAIFLPFLQAADSSSTLLVRSSLDQSQLTAAVRKALRELDSGLPVDAEMWTGKLSVVLFPARIATITLGVLGLLGATLSLTGIFGLAAYSVSRRKRELGIRMALGAQRIEVLQAALGRTAKLLLLGSVAGLVLGMLASRVLAALVYEATPRDPLVLAGVVLAMSIVGLLATSIPAQRALSANPAALLREE